MASPYVKDDQGGTFIPASQRPDGTWRKSRRVKDGYVPQEEVPLYESKGKQFTKNKPAYPVGMTPEFIAAHKARKEQSKTNPIPGLVIQPEEGKKKKKKKGKGGAVTITDDLARTSITEEPAITTKSQKEREKPEEKEKSKSTANPASHVAPNKQISIADPLKRLKNLRKKIKEIESLEQKIKNKEIKNPDKEMLEKVARKNEVQEEIKQLEANQ